ncbi:unnamed protein product [Closterium sp. NIES-54]
MYALTISAEGDCYLCVPPDLGIEAAALGASESALPVTPLPAPVAVRLADPSGGPVLARSSTVIPCPADAMVTTTTPGGQHVSICTCTWTGRHLATFTLRPGSSLYTLATEPPQVQLLLPRSLPPLPPSPAPPCLPCIKGQQRAAPHSSSLPPTTAPLQTLNMDIRGPVASVERAASANFWWLLMTTRSASSSASASARTFLSYVCTLIEVNGVAERRIGLVMEVARTSMIHAAAPHFLWPFARPAPSGVSQVDPLSFTEPVEVAVNFCATGVGAARGAASGGAEPERAKPGGAEPGVAESEGAEPGGAESDRAEPGSGGAEPGGTVSPGGPTGASSQREPLSPPQLHEWFAWYTRLRSGAAGAGGPAAIVSGDAGTGAAGPGGARAAGPGGARNGAGGAGAGGTGGVRAAGPRGARSGGTGAAGGGGGAGLQGAGGALGAGGAGAADPGGARTGGPGAAGAGGVAGAGAGDSVAGEPGA